MGYISILIGKNNNDKKYLLFYADYLQEVWLSEVLENDTTKIIKQFRCQNAKDVEKLATYLSKSGEVRNLYANDKSDESLMILEQKLKNVQISTNEFSFLELYRRFLLWLIPFSKPVLQ